MGLIILGLKKLDKIENERRKKGKKKIKMRRNEQTIRDTGRKLRKVFRNRCFAWVT